MKTCTKCKAEKSLFEFGENKTKCKSCTNEYAKQYRLNNKERLTEVNKQYSLKNKERIKQYRLDNNNKIKQYRIDNKDKISEYNKQYKLKNKDYYCKYYLYNKDKIKEQKKEYRGNNKNNHNEWSKNKRKMDSLYKLKCYTRSLICSSIKKQGYSKKSRTYQILGCDYETFKAHLEKQFTKGMSWSNQGEWHLDHIYPVSLARDEEHLIELNHYTNFQPLWAIDNLSKGNKIIEKQLFLL